MKALPRISRIEVLEAYRKTGLHPIREMYIDWSSEGLCGCPLGALYVSKHPRERELPMSTLYAKADAWADKIYGVQFTLAFTAAFDRGVGNLETTCPYSEERSIAGWEDGRAAAFAVLTGV